MCLILSKAQLSSQPVIGITCRSVSPRTDFEVRSATNTRWLPPLALVESKEAAMHTRPTVPKIASMGMQPRAWVGGSVSPVVLPQILLSRNLSSDSARAIGPEYTFLLKSPISRILSPAAFHWQRRLIRLCRKFTLVSPISPLAPPGGSNADAASLIPLYFLVIAVK